MMPLPILETSRLRLRPRTLGDLEDFFRMDREPETLDWIPWPEPAGSWDDLDAHRAFIRARTVPRYPPGQGYWVVAEKARPDLFLGWVLLIPQDVAGPEAASCRVAEKIGMRAARPTPGTAQLVRYEARPGRR